MELSWVKIQLTLHFDYDQSKLLEWLSFQH
jgi:hypothetical protein